MLDKHFDDELKKKQLNLWDGVKDQKNDKIVLCEQIWKSHNVMLTLCLDLDEKCLSSQVTKSQTILHDLWVI